MNSENNLECHVFDILRRQFYNVKLKVKHANIKFIPIINVKFYCHDLQTIHYTKDKLILTLYQ